MDKALTEPKLTPKQAKFLQAYFESGNATLSAMSVYDVKDYNSASVMGSQILRKLKVPMRALMEAKGLSTGKLIETVHSALDAKRVISAIAPDKDASGATTDFIEIDDHATRLKAVQIASKWLDLDGAPQTQTNIQINVTPILGGTDVLSDDRNQEDPQA